MEIGSEYWLEPCNDKESTYNIVEQDNMVLLMSGRTAIDLTLDIINISNNIKTVYMPSYCCESMLVAFKKRNLQIKFYNVAYRNGNLLYDINLQQNCDLFFAMNYFGFTNYNMDFYIEYYKKKGSIVIEDGTHSFLSQRKYSTYSDFVIVSLRKWFPIISGGLLIGNNEKYLANLRKQREILNDNKEYTELKKKAMEEKSKYIQNQTIPKETFLNKFKEADKILKYNYQYYKIDEISENILRHINVNQIAKLRMKNVRVIYNFLKQQKNIGFLKKIDFHRDCPLFVPIFLGNEEREKLRKKLIENHIFCPTHWPIPIDIQQNNQKEIYKSELSLVCDQRYSEAQIQNYMNLLKNGE